MDFSRGRSLLKPLLKIRGWTQSELSRRTGYDPSVKSELRVGYSPRMISFFANGKPMSPEAMYTISYLLGVHMEELHEWIENQ